MAVDLSVTALLDDLLAEQGCNDADPSKFAPPLRPDAGIAEAKRLCAADDGHGGQTEEEQQLAELCGEMDACLASLNGWEAQRERDREALKKQLEAQYGFSYEDAVLDTAEDAGKNGEDEYLQADRETLADSDDCEAALESEPIPSSGSLARGGAGRDLPTTVVEQPAPFNRMVDAMDAELDANVRLNKLRAEVEELRKNALAEATSSPWDDDVSALDVSALDGLAALDSTSLGPDNSALDSSAAQWCRDVEAVLGSGGGDSGGDFDLAALDAKMAMALNQGGEINLAMENANARIDAELADLDKMMAECDAVHAKLAIRN
jgi:hypothetical protein